MFNNQYVFTVRHISPGPQATHHIGHSATQLNETTAVIHGGLETSTWCFDLHSNYWTKLTHQPSTKPPSTIRHIAAAFNETTLLIYGGDIRRTKMAYNGIWLLQFHNLHNCSGEWINMTNRIQGGHLPPRYGQSATTFRNYIIIYGGLNSHSVRDEYNSVYDKSITVIDTTQTGPNLQIQQIPISPAIPVRFLHSLSVYTSDALLLMGGASSKSGEDQQQAYLLQLSHDFPDTQQSVTAISILLHWSIGWTTRGAEPCTLNCKLSQSSNNSSNYTTPTNVLLDTKEQQTTTLANNVLKLHLTKYPLPMYSLS